MLHRARPAYVSPATQSATIAINGGAPAVMDLTPSAPGCQAVSQGFACSITVSAPVGNDTFVITTFDGTGGAGSRLSTGTITQPVVSGNANAVNATLDGIIATLALAVQGTPPPEGASATVGLSVTGKDADGDAIVGPGIYDTAIALTDTDASGTTALTTASATSPSTAVSITYNGKPLSSAGGNALIGGSVQVASGTATASAFFATAQSDWDTWGDGPTRQSYNATETVLTAQNVSGLHQLWKTVVSDGAIMVGQAVVAGNVSTAQGPLDMLYVGDAHGMFYALNAGTGAILWTKQLQTQTAPSSTNCFDLPGSEYGIQEAAQIDRSSNRVYVVDGAGMLYAFDLASGTQRVGPVPLFPSGSIRQNAVYGGLNLDATKGLLYTGIAAKCGLANDGAVVQYNVASGAVSRFIGAGDTAQEGAGIWGPGGVVLDPNGSSNIFAVTADGPQGTQANGQQGYGSSVLRMSDSLSVVAANTPVLLTNDADFDFGDSPLVFTPSGGCGKTLLVAGNKNGEIFVYDANNIGNGALQTLAIAASNLGGTNLPTPAYDPVSGHVFINNGSDDPNSTHIYRHGLLALSVTASCTLSLAWNAAVGPNGTSDGPPAPPVVANGVVYYADGPGSGCTAIGETQPGAPPCTPGVSDLYAFSAQTGTMLRDVTLQGPLFTTPTIINGHVYVVSWNGLGPAAIYAFGP